MSHHPHCESDDDAPGSGHGNESESERIGGLFPSLTLVFRERSVKRGDGRIRGLPFSHFG